MSIPIAAAKFRHPKIVIVNDEPTMLDIFEEMIRKWYESVTILTFQYPEKALEELLRSAPDLLITDDAMSKMWGEELVNRLAATGITYPIIATSAYSGTKEWVQKWAECGLRISFLDQPFTIEQLSEELTKHLGPGVKP